MPEIKLFTIIDAPIEVCFDLCRSIDLHSISTVHTQEKAIAGRTSGLIELNETVTWQAKHLGFRQTLTSKITAFNKPFYFVDEQLKGTFKSIHHQHIFEEKDGQVMMTDIFNFESPFGILGMIFNTIFLKKYMTNFLITRNAIIKEYAETEQWKSILN